MKGADLKKSSFVEPDLPLMKDSTILCLIRRKHMPYARAVYNWLHQPHTALKSFIYFQRFGNFFCLHLHCLACDRLFFCMYLSSKT